MFFIKFQLSESPKKYIDDDFSSQLKSICLNDNNNIDNNIYKDYSAKVGSVISNLPKNLPQMIKEYVILIHTVL